MKLGAPPVRRGSLQGPGTALVVPQQPQNQRGPYRLRGAFAQSDQVLANEYQSCSGKPWLRRKRWRGCGRSPAGAEARRDFAPFSARHPEGTRSCPDTRPRPRRRLRECRSCVDIHLLAIFFAASFALRDAGRPEKTFTNIPYGIQVFPSPADDSGVACPLRRSTEKR